MTRGPRPSHAATLPPLGKGQRRVFIPVEGREDCFEAARRYARSLGVSEADLALPRKYGERWAFVVEDRRVAR